MLGKFLEEGDHMSLELFLEGVEGRGFTELGDVCGVELRGRREDIHADSDDGVERFFILEGSFDEDS